MTEFIEFTDQQRATIEDSVEMAFCDGKSEAYSWVLRDRDASPAVRLHTGQNPLDTLAKSVEHEETMHWRYTAWCFAHNIAVACAIETATEAIGGRVAESQPITYPS